MKKWRTPTPLLGVVGIAGAALAGLVTLALKAGPVDGAFLWPEVAKALISVLAVALIGGTIKLLLDQHVRDRLARESEVAFIRDCMMEAEDIRRVIEHARMLIKAHRSARSYRDRMQEVIASSVRMESMARRVEIRWSASPPRDRVDVVQVVRGRTNSVNGLLKKLVSEYEHGYKKVADLQRIDEAVATKMIEEYAKSGAQLPHSERPPMPNLEWSAWKDLDSRHFPTLQEFLSDEPASAYHTTFSPDCRAIVDALNDILVGISR